MGKLLNAILLVIGLVLAALCVRQRTEICRIRRQLNVEAATARTTVPSAVTNRLASTNARAGFTNVMAGTGKSGTTTTPAVNPFLEALQDPARRENMKSVWSMQMDSIYGPLLRSMQMTPDELNEFKGFLMAKRWVNVDFGMKLAAAETNEAGQAQIEQQRKQTQDEIDGRIRQYLGENAYAEYDGYEKSLTERTMLGDFKQELENIKAGLTYEQEDKLIRMMYEERTKSPVLNHAIEESDSVANRSPDEWKDVLREFDQWKTRVDGRAAELLSPAQRKLLDEHMTRYGDVIRVSMKNWTPPTEGAASSNNADSTTPTPAP